MDKTVRVWSHVKNQFKEWLTLIGHNDKVRTMVFYDEYLASGGDDTEIIVWSLLNGDIVHRISDSNQGRVSAMLATRISSFKSKPSTLSLDATRPSCFSALRISLIDPR
jgi:WD40 repeat protein